MKIGFTPRDYLHFARMVWRGRRRNQAWGKLFEACVRNGSFQLPAAAVVQFIPTEGCNLRCPFCNQWGENGYFLAGARRVASMDESCMSKLVAQLSPRDSLVNIHGGEPFAYKHIDTLLDVLSERQFDVLITTNGTLLGKHLEPLASLRNLAFILSIDGDEEIHDRIRGKGTFQQIREGITRLFELRRGRGLPLPLVIMSTVVCESTTDVVEKAYVVARSLNAFMLNYNFRYFLPESAGLAYEKHLKEVFGLQSSGAWRGWIVRDYEKNDYREVADRVRRLLRAKRFNLRPPYVVSGPSQLRGQDYDNWFTDFLNTFGNESCFMPFYWARVHANGDLIFCPGHPDIIAGNVFRDGFMESFNSEMAVRFRKHILQNRFPICNRCCGLYMTNPARPFEQRARRRLGLRKEVTVHYHGTS
ncbi:MAG TPA: radical SAM protein [Pyrinomonadaceae bacterium]|jgi:MoaA/NifB/PqqE/SkfB family radical SAM enzyme